MLLQKNTLYKLLNDSNQTQEEKEVKMTVYKSIRAKMNL